jgi:hypothetical protein
LAFESEEHGRKPVLEKRSVEVGYFWETGGKKWLARDARNGYKGVKRKWGCGVDVKTWKSGTRFWEDR